MFASFLEEKYETPELEFYLDSMIKFGHLGEIPKSSLKSILGLAGRRLRATLSTSASPNLKELQAALERLPILRRDDVMEIAVEFFKRRRNLGMAETLGGEMSPGSGREEEEEEEEEEGEAEGVHSSQRSLVMLMNGDRAGEEGDHADNTSANELSDLEERLKRTQILLEREEERARDMGGKAGERTPKVKAVTGDGNHQRPSTLMKMTASAKMKRKSTGGGSS